jgi:CelD/BcsL family acetyltransferase involved in cellulose biosynthesis
VHVPKESGNVRVLEEATGNSKLAGFPAKTSQILFYLAMTGSWMDYLRGRSSNFRKSLNGTIRRARQEGTVEVEREEDPKEVEASMGRLFRLEARSWKHQDSKAAFSAEEKAFTLDIARKFSHSGRVSNLFMTLDGTDAVALHSIVYEGVCYGFLIYYDEKYDKWSPGRYLLAESLSRYWAEGGIREFDFNGESRFVRRWTERFRRYETISLCNRSLYSCCVGGFKLLKSRFVPEAYPPGTAENPPPRGDGQENVRLVGGKNSHRNSPADIYGTSPAQSAGKPYRDGK